MDVSAAAAFPPVPAGALIYVRVSERDRGTVSRYVLYEGGTFALQQVTARWGFSETTGRYARVNASISLDFDANQPQWQATATIQGDTLVVDYSPTMELDHSEDGVYRLAATPRPRVYDRGALGDHAERPGEYGGGGAALGARTGRERRSSGGRDGHICGDGRGWDGASSGASGDGRERDRDSGELDLGRHARGEHTQRDGDRIRHRWQPGICLAATATGPALTQQGLKFPCSLRRR